MQLADQVQKADLLASVGGYIIAAGANFATSQVGGAVDGSYIEAPV
jgi:hypothetical protein